VLVEDAKALTDAQARDLVARSHALVMAKLTKKEREAIGANDGAFRHARDPRSGSAAQAAARFAARPDRAR
jgi:hypothetical protein